MKTNTTLKSKFNSAFSLVELLVVIAVIAVIAAIAIPNISDITGGARTASEQRTAQNLASLASSAVASGYDASANTTVALWVTALETGITNTVAGEDVVFRADGVPTDNGYQTYLSVSGTSLVYNPDGAAAAD